MVRGFVSEVLLRVDRGCTCGSRSFSLMGRVNGAWVVRSGEREYVEGQGIRGQSSHCSSDNVGRRRGRLTHRRRRVAL